MSDPKITDIATTQWLEDANGNRASSEYFGSIGAAQAALDSLKNCRNCINCSYCSYCSPRANVRRKRRRLRLVNRKPYCSGLRDMNNRNADGNVLQAPPIPVIENIHQAVYRAATHSTTALNMSRWHSCETTHCRAGWVVTLAGEAGKALEDWYSTPHAAMLIYFASDPTLKMVPLWVDSNENALADMKRLADEEAARVRLA